MIKAIIFDFFGVLVTEGTTAFVEAFYPNIKAKIKQTDKYIDELNLGILSYEEYLDHLAELGGAGREEVRAYLDTNKPNRPLLDYIKKELKSKYKLGVISNASADWIYEILDKTDIELFDDIVLSHSAGVIKPEPAIYELSLGNLKVRADEVVFIDDIEKYCEAARGVGMKSIRYENFKQAKADLNKILVSDSNN
ncbi:MAG: HAD family phosphatase [Candidatus Saccharimonadales bacterium]